MKTTITLSLLLVASLVPATSTQASDRALKGALIGGVAGALIGSAGNGDHNDVVTGAVFGATAGALIGASSDDRGHQGYRGGPRVSVNYSAGYGYGHGGFGYGVGYGYRPYRHYGYGWGYPSIYYSRPVYYSPNYEYAQPVQVVSAPEAQQTTQPAQSSPQNVTIINNYYGGSSAMSSANGMFGR